MSGNPYTESGKLFKIPDILANRADIYNLGEALGGDNAGVGDRVVAQLADLVESVQTLKNR
ncbi:hypothetical protein [Xenorhabdus japonica]|nr:hypothetical protein [Xenorhabdus japonica]